jgi:hypothetical protein
MGILDRLFGRRTRSADSPAYGSSPSWGTPPSQQPSGPYANNEQPSSQQAARDAEAVRRYRYLLRTAPPEAIEQAHAEAFEQLSPDQRRQVLQQLSQQVPEHERGRSDDPASLARMATRAELRQPGVLVQVLGPGGYGPGYGRGYGYGGGYGGGFGGMGGFGGGGMGMGMGGMIAGSLLASVAGSFIGTAIADEFFDHDQYDAFNQSIGDVDTGAAGGDAGSGIDFDNSNVDTSGVDDQSFADTGGGSGDSGYDPGYDDGGGSDFGDFGDGGDFGGGDW